MLGNGAFQHNSDFNRAFRSRLSFHRGCRIFCVQDLQATGVADSVEKEASPYSEERLYDLTLHQALQAVLKQARRKFPERECSPDTKNTPSRPWFSFLVYGGVALNPKP